MLDANFRLSDDNNDKLNEMKIQYVFNIYVTWGKLFHTAWRTLTF